ncbi:MAG: hypothetical protein JHC33_05645 [Ignisphaera sp.]|nr:hypothetical protein [Ignisphaera sp.]
MNKNSPLDFMLTEGKDSGALFGDSDVNEIMLPDMGEDEGFESPAEEASETPEKETDEELDTLSKELKELKDKLDELKVKYPEDTNAEVASALDDATSAIDLAVHHLDDIGEDLETEEKPLMDKLPGGEELPGSGSELPAPPAPPAEGI